MGISTTQGYCGAQVFEAVGLSNELVDKYFTWTASRIGGVGLDVIAEETRQRHAYAFDKTGSSRSHARSQVANISIGQMAQSISSIRKRSISFNTLVEPAITKSSKSTADR